MRHEQNIRITNVHLVQIDPVSNINTEGALCFQKCCGIGVLIKEIKNMGINHCILVNHEYNTGQYWFDTNI